jgi:hypothetical protein
MIVVLAAVIYEKQTAKERKKERHVYASQTN